MIEVSAVIIILSFLMVPLLGFMIEQQMQERRIKGEEINERVLAAIALFVKNNGRYPCPADASLPYGDASFGHEDCTLSNAGGTIQGALPIYNLGLPYRLMFDSYKNQYIYAVTTVETSPSTYTGGGVIRIVDENDGNIAVNVPFVIVNIGEDGKGRIKNPADGTIVAASCDPAGGTTAEDSENCDNDNVFKDMPYSQQSNPDDANHYDDLIFYDLARAESGMWLARQNDAGDGMQITNRNTGNVGIGTYSASTPSEKFEVMGGNLRVDAGDIDVMTGGKVESSSYCVADPVTGVCPP